jgi:hypothetical protein
MTYEKYRNLRYGNLMTSERYVNLMKIEWCRDLKSFKRCRNLEIGNRHGSLVCFSDQDS